VPILFPRCQTCSQTFFSISSAMLWGIRSLRSTRPLTRKMMPGLVSKVFWSLHKARQRQSLLCPAANLPTHLTYSRPSFTKVLHPRLAPTSTRLPLDSKQQQYHPGVVKPPPTFVQPSSTTSKRKLQDGLEQLEQRQSKHSKLAPTSHTQPRRVPSSANVMPSARPRTLQQAPAARTDKTKPFGTCEQQRGHRQAKTSTPVSSSYDPISKHKSKDASTLKAKAPQATTPPSASSTTSGTNIGIAFALPRTIAEPPRLTFFDLPRELRDMIYLNMISMYKAPHWQYRRTVDGTLFKVKLLLISRQFSEEYADLFLRLKTFRLVAEDRSVTHPPMLFDVSYFPQAPLHIFRHIELIFHVGDYKWISVVDRKQKRKPETVASALSHTMGKMKCLQTIDVRILIADRTLEKDFRKVFEEDGSESICPAWKEIEGRKEVDVRLVGRM
jgi:hypothetical protein